MLEIQRSEHASGLALSLASQSNLIFSLVRRYVAKGEIICFRRPLFVFLCHAKEFLANLQLPAVARRMGNGLVDAADIPAFKEDVVAFRIFGAGVALQGEHFFVALSEPPRSASDRLHCLAKAKLLRNEGQNVPAPGQFELAWSDRQTRFAQRFLRRCCIGLCFKTRSRLLRRRRPKHYPRKSASDLGHLNCRADMLTERTVLFCVVRFIGHNLILLAFK